jgi:DNA-binding transcriptional LysR family regulator
MSAQLQAGQVDLCLASQPLLGRSVQATKLLTEEVLLGVPRSHRLAARNRASMEDLVAEPFVTTRPGYWQRGLADQLFARVGGQPAIACEGDEPYAIRGLISAGAGVGLLPAMARRTARPPIAWLHLDAPGCQRTLSIAWRRDAYLSTAAQQFRDFAAGYFAGQPALD